MPLFCCHLFFKRCLKPQLRMNKIARENGVIYHPTSPSESRSKIHISIKPFGAFPLSINVIEFSLKNANPTMDWEYFQINGVQITGVQKTPHRQRETTLSPKHYFSSSREKEETMKSLLILLDLRLSPKLYAFPFMKFFKVISSAN